VWGRGDALSVVYGWRGKEPGCTGVRDGTTGGALGVSCGAARGKKFSAFFVQPARGRIVRILFVETNGARFSFSYI
jgi:hypothetical protein